MTSLLEERYRRMLRLLPEAYRQTWEEDMVATFMECAYASDPDDPEGVELGRPTRSELASVATLALRLRLGGVGAEPRSFAWGEAVRRVALVGLLAHAVGALVGVLFIVWIAYRLPGLGAPADAVPIGLTGRWQALWGLTGLLWIPAYLALVQGHRRVARVLGLVALVPVLVGMLVDVLGTDGAFAFSRTYWLLFDALPVLALAAFHRAAPPVRARPWLVALPVGTGLTFAVLLLAKRVGSQELLLDLPGLWCVGLTVAAAAYLVLTTAGRRPANPHWALALALFAVAAFGLRAVTLVDHLSFAVATPDRSVLLTVYVAEALAMLLVVAVLAPLSRRALRRLPPTRSV